MPALRSCLKLVCPAVRSLNVLASFFPSLDYLPAQNYESNFKLSIVINESDESVCVTSFAAISDITASWSEMELDIK